MITIVNSISIVKAIGKTDGTPYTTSNVHLEVINPNGTVLIHTPTVVLPTIGVTDGSITFSISGLAPGNNRLTMFYANNNDLDTASVQLTKLGARSIRYVNDAPTSMTL